MDSDDNTKEKKEICLRLFEVVQGFKGSKGQEFKGSRI